MGWLRGLRRCSCTYAVFLPNFPLQCTPSLLWACSLRSPALCGFVQFLEVFLLVSSVARAVNVLSLDSCFLETSALTTQLTCGACEHLDTHPAEACLENGATPRSQPQRACSFGGWFIPWCSECLSDLEGVSVLTTGVHRVRIQSKQASIKTLG